MKHRITIAVSLLASSLAVFAAPASAEQPHPFAGDRQLTVMTRNLYLGTDLRPIFSAPTPFALFAAAGAGYAQVEANRPAERMAAIADEIAAAQPDVVAIQEAAIFRTDVPPDGAASPAETTTYDLLDLLVDALDARGAPYEVVGELSGTDAELPAGLPPTRDVRLTDRIALLARGNAKTADLKIESVASGHYAARLVVPTVAGPIAVPRGWIAADVKVRGKVVRVVATHLEAFSDAAQVAQAGELLAGPAATDLPVLIAGDLNTRADGLGSPTYGILRNAGFADSWSGPGTTCCRAPDLSLPSVLDKRVDLVLSRGGFDVVRAEIVDGKTASGLWHSDHAGFVATLGFPD